MFVSVRNENYGYSVATHDDWVVVGNPSSFRYKPESSSFWRTGSIDVFKYDPTSDEHVLLATIYKPIGSLGEVLLCEDEYTSSIHTDIYKINWVPIIYSRGRISKRVWYNYTQQDIPIKIDDAGYSSTIEDDYGHSIDVYNDVLAVGSRWHNQQISFANKIYYITGSSVDLYNLTQLDYDPCRSYMSTGSGLLASIIPPPADESVSGSFGHSVSINDEWLAVGSPNWNNTLGGVHMYRRQFPQDPNNFTWTFFSTITGSANVVGDYFGYSIDLNKATGSYSGSIIVGCGNKIFAGSKVYYFEFDGSNWKEKNTFQADRRVYNLPFYDVKPVCRCDDYSIDSFGTSVALYKNDIAIGAPTDRWIYEFSGSRAYKQGSCYLYRRCDDTTRGWELLKKFYGNENTIKNNKMGFCVDLWDDKLVVGCPKANVETMTSCYVEGSVFQQNYCYSDLENYINGQWILFQKNTSSLNWDVLNVYQRKKRFLTPYRSFGYSVAIANKSIVVGSPMIIYDTNRTLNVKSTGSWQGDNYLELEDLNGKSYIYNLKNFRENFYVGNVFYRNGKIVLNTSGSDFKNLWFNDINEYNYEYEVHYDSKQTLYEKQIVCTVNPGEFNISTNPTSLIQTNYTLDFNKNGIFDWQDLDITLKYMQYINTKYSSNQTTDWSSSLVKTDDEISYYNFNSSRNSYYNTNADYISQSFSDLLNNFSDDTFDFNEDSKVDKNDMNIIWKYYNNRLTQINYESYITANSKRKLFNDIIDHLNGLTGRNSPKYIKSDFLTFVSQSASDKTGSYLSPYITSVGLYSGLDLVAVAKLGSPIKNTGEFPLNIVVKIDF